MRKTLSKPVQTAVRVTAVLLIALLILAWLFLAFLTTNDVASDDYYATTKTQFVTTREEEMDSDAFFGAAFYAEKGKCAERMKRVMEENKMPFVILPTDVKEAEELAEECEKAREIGVKIYFCSEGREALEKIVGKYRTITCLWMVSSSIQGSLAIEMGYSYTLPVEKITAKAVEKAHDSGHYLVATGVKSEKDAEKCRQMKVDYAFTEAGFLNN